MPSAWAATTRSDDTTASRVRARPRRRRAAGADATLQAVSDAAHETGIPFQGWTKQADPDPHAVRALYVDGGLTGRAIAVRLGVSRQRVASALAQAPVPRRPPRRECPVPPDVLTTMFVNDGLTQRELAERFGVAPGTMSRWLAECGLGQPDPRLDHDRLHELYVDQQMTVREVAEQLGVSHNRVIRELALAGIPRRSRHHRPPNQRRAEVTEAALHDLYIEQRLTVKQTATALGVSDEYVRKRLRECGIAKRPGSFTPKTMYAPDELQQLSVERYVDAGMTMADTGAELGVSSTRVRQSLHEAQAPVRPGGLPHVTRDLRNRRLIRDLYADPEVRGALRRHHVVLQDPLTWAKPSPVRSLAPLPLSRELLRDLYCEVGLSMYHISLLCGVGEGTVVSRLRRVGLPVRPSGPLCPWLQRLISSRSPESRQSG